MGYIPPVEADKRYILTAGDQMSGPLLVQGDPTNNPHPGRDASVITDGDILTAVQVIRNEEQGA